MESKLVTNIEIAESTTTQEQEIVVKEIEVELTIEQKIRNKAVEYNLNPDLMVKIAKAESWSNGEFRNVWNFRYKENPNYYTAFGIFQIVKSTYASFCGDPDERFDVDKNIECAMIIASTSGVHHWGESEHNWKY